MIDRRIWRAATTASSSLREHLRRRRPEGCIILPVPAAASLAAARLIEDSRQAGGLPTHLTILYPFRAAAVQGGGVLDPLGDLAREVEPFPYRLVGVGTFDDVVYLRPEPERPFRALVDGVLARWPDEQPYGGRFDRFIPHVTVAGRPEPPGFVPQLEAALSVDCWAEELSVMVREPRAGWRLVGRTRLGRSPA